MLLCLQACPHLSSVKTVEDHFSCTSDLHFFQHLHHQLRRVFLVSAIMIPKELTEVFCSFCGKQFLSEAGQQYAAAMTLHGKMQQPKIQVSTNRTSSAHPMPRMMTIRQVAETGVMSETTLRMLLKQKRLPAVYVGNKALINYQPLPFFMSSKAPSRYPSRSPRPLPAFGGPENLDYYTAIELVILRTAEIEVFYEVKSGRSGKKIMAAALDDSEIKI